MIPMRPAAAMFFVAISILAQTSSSYRVSHRYTLGGDGSWDYVVPDPPNHRVFIGRQDRVMVVDEDSGKLLGKSLASKARTEQPSPHHRDTDSQRQATMLPW